MRRPLNPDQPYRYRRLRRTHDRRNGLPVLLVALALALPPLLLGGLSPFHGSLISLSATHQANRSAPLVTPYPVASPSLPGLLQTMIGVNLI